MHLLLVEDEVASAEVLSAFLEMHEFDVTMVHDGDEAMQIIRSGTKPFDLAILDIMVPGTDGRALCEAIRKHPLYAEIPVIFLTAKDQEQDEILGLTIGADDYIPKPASLNLVLAHVQSLLRRRRKEPASAEILLGDLSVDTSAAEVKVGGNLVELTLTEFKILEMLARQPKRVFSRQEILEHISDDVKLVFDRTVDVHIKNIRLKLGNSGKMIKTFRGLGYGIDRTLLN